MSKHRLSASVDADLFVAAERAVSEGLAENVSAWVNAAMRRQVERDDCHVIALLKRERLAVALR